MKKIFIVLLGVLFTSLTHADYNANMTGVITQLLTYAGSQTILFALNNQPSSHPSCNHYYFSLGSDIDDASRSRTYARLMVAYTTGERVNIGYDNAGSCADGYIRAYRVG